MEEKINKLLEKNFLTNYKPSKSHGNIKTTHKTIKGQKWPIHYTEISIGAFHAVIKKIKSISREYLKMFVKISLHMKYTAVQPKISYEIREIVTETYIS